MRISDNTIENIDNRMPSKWNSNAKRTNPLRKERSQNSSRVSKNGKI